MSKPSDFAAGLKQFVRFNHIDPKRAGRLDITVPTRVSYIGDAEFTAYRSSKVMPNTPKGSNDYWHDHEAGVGIYVPDRQGDCNVPSWLRETRTIVRLGACLDVGFKHEGKIATLLGTRTFKNVDEVEVTTHSADLFCTPNARALLVVQRGRLVALMWGGFLDVTERGIVG